MNRVAIAYLSKNRDHIRSTSLAMLMPEVSGGKFDLFCIDGSEAIWRPASRGGLKYYTFFGGVQGGADATIVKALTEMLAINHYDYVGLVEMDVLLDPTWYAKTMALFLRGWHDGLEVGAVSPRCYEDRILIQRDGYAVMHNLGAGMVIFSRDAARLILDNYRTGWTTENRQVFVQLTGLDIGAWWAFRGGEHPLTADWSWDAILAKHGLASLALTPSLATMLDQDIAAQGLKMADGKMDLLRNDGAFEKLKSATFEIRDGGFSLGSGGRRLLSLSGGVSIFPHQIPGIGGLYNENWYLMNSQGWGPFGWKAGDEECSVDGELLPLMSTLTVPILGPCEFTVQGPGRFRVTDEASGYQIAPELPAGQMSQLVVPSGISYRNVRLEALTPGCTFHGIQCRETQPWLSSFRFDHSSLPPV